MVPTINYCSEFRSNYRDSLWKAYNIVIISWNYLRFAFVVYGMLWTGNYLAIGGAGSLR